MNKYFIVLISVWVVFPFGLTAQIKTKTLNSDTDLTNGRLVNDTLSNKNEISVELDGKTHYTDYKIISYQKDTTIIDTTLTLKHERKFNYIRKNIFELMRLHNTGQAFNLLSYQFNDYSVLPEMGMRAKFYNFYKTEDVEYYRVPTPTSELTYQTGVQQGHMLNSLITFNVNPQLNISLSYKGLRSLGDYRQSLSSHQNFRMTASYTSKKNKYIFRTHYAGQKLTNQENGGLTPESVMLYETNNSDYTDRERLLTNFLDAESKLRTRRYYYEHGYNLWYKPTDSLHKTGRFLQIGHIFSHSRKYYTYDQTAANSIFGTAYTTKIQDSTFYYKTINGAFAELQSPMVLGKLHVEAQYTSLRYGFQPQTLNDTSPLPYNITEHTTALQAFWQAKFKSFSLQSSAGNIFEGQIKGNFIGGTASFAWDSLFTVKAEILLKSQSPNYIFRHYQSGYQQFNWNNNFENERTRYVGFSLLSDKLMDAEVNFTQKDFYTYFNQSVKPEQYSQSLVYMKAKAHREFRWHKWAFDTTFLYQKVAQGSDVLHLPDWITENTFYFSDDVFKRKPMYLQTGITVKSFDKYYADEFNPVLNEFYLQTDKLIGNYPLIDVFANARVQRARLFLKFENINALWDGGKYWVTPTQPYLDFRVRFGIIWTFFI